MRNYLVLNIFTVLALIFMVGCKSKQPISVSTEEKVINYDSIYLSKKVERNKAIIDSLTITLGAVKTNKKGCDSICQIAINRMLSQLNTSKKSGNNSYDLHYNEKNNTLNFNSKIGPTESGSVIEYRNVGTIKTIHSHRDVPVEKPLPKWKLALMLIGIMTIVFVLIKIVTFIRSITSLKNH